MVNMKLQRPPGTRDFLPEENSSRRHVEKQMRELMGLWGYREIGTPTFEHLELFTLKSGDDIVKGLYDFEDKGGRMMALRPELTAPVMRAYVDSLQSDPKPLRLYYFDRCFRYERTQRARYREFWHFGVELIGGSSPWADAEVIALASALARKVGANAELRVGHLGVMRRVLENVDENVQRNVLRHIDKGEYDEALSLLTEFEGHDFVSELVGARGNDALDAASKATGDCEELMGFRHLLELLDTYGIEYVVDFSVVRGLDYYEGAVFEMYGEGLGAENQICGGGSYRLVGLFGGEDISSTGFAFGFDRLMEICEVDVPVRTSVVVACTDDVRMDAVKVAGELRETLSDQKVSVYLDVMDRSLSKQFSFADSIGGRFTVILGSKEVAEDNITLRDMLSGEQEQLSFEKTIERILEGL